MLEVSELLAWSHNPKYESKVWGMPCGVVAMGFKPLKVNITIRRACWIAEKTASETGDKPGRRAWDGLPF